MRKALAVLLLVCMAGVAGAGSTANAPEALDEDLWNWSCEYMRVFHDTSCENLDPPKILWTEFRWTRNDGKPNPNMRGAHYAGSDYIMLNVRLVGTQQARVTALHESVHYIIRQVKLKKSRCEGEEIARRAHHAFDNSKYNDRWKSWYNCNK